MKDQMLINTSTQLRLKMNKKKHNYMMDELVALLGRFFKSINMSIFSKEDREKIQEIERI